MYTCILSVMAIENQGHVHSAAVGGDHAKTRDRRVRTKKRSGRCRPSRPGTPTTRWALEAHKVGNRRMRRRRRQGLILAKRLGGLQWWEEPSWTPWTREKDIGEEKDDCGIQDHPHHRAAVDAEDLRGATVTVGLDGQPAATGLPDASVKNRQRPTGREDAHQPRGRRHRPARKARWGLPKVALTAIMCAAMLGQRIGEASNPGYGILDPSLTRLRVTSTRSRGTGIKYAEPLKDGFRDVHTPGFGSAEGGAEEGMQDKGLSIESANTTGTKSLKKRLKATQADVLMVQETWATSAVVDDIATWAKRKRWTSLWTPAKEGTNGGRLSGGTAIFARDHLGLRKPDWGSEVWAEHRAAARAVDAPNLRPMLCVSA